MILIKPQKNLMNICDVAFAGYTNCSLAGKTGCTIIGKALENIFTESNLLVSKASIWEIVIKAKTGKLDLD